MKDDHPNLETTRRVLDAFEAADWDEVHLEFEGLAIHLSAAGKARDLESRSVRPPSAAPRREPEPTSAEAAADMQDLAPTDNDVPAIHPPETEEVSYDGPVVEIMSPSMGLFWGQSQPGAPPFVSVGDRVDPDTTVCIVEVMKLMNYVKAGFSGRIVRVFGTNGGSVRQGEPLFLVALDAG